MDKEKLLEAAWAHCGRVPCCECKYNGKRYCQVRGAYDILEKAGALKEQPPALPRKKTGVLIPVGDLVKGDVNITFRENPGVRIGDTERFEIKEGYEHLYKEIEEVIDYAQVPLGSIVELCLHSNLLCTQAGIVREVPLSRIFSLKVIRWGR